MAWAIESYRETVPPCLEYALSTIKSPVFSNVTVIYDGEHYFRTRCTLLAFIYLPTTYGDTDTGSPRYDRLSEFHRKMRMVRGFQLVLHVDCVGDRAERGVKELERGIANPHGEMNDIYPRPLVTSMPWGNFPHLGEFRFVSTFSDRGAVFGDTALRLAHLGF